MALPSSGQLSLDDIRDYIVPIAGVPLFNPISLSQLATTLAVGFRVSAFYSYDLVDDVNIYLAALRANAWPTAITSQEETAVYDLFFQLDSYGLYSKIAAFYPMIGTTANTIKLNAKSSGGVRQSNLDIAFFGGWSFYSNYGAVGNGSNTYWLVDYTYDTTSITDSHFGIYQSSTSAFGGNAGYDIAVYPLSSGTINYYSPFAYSNSYYSFGIVFNYSYTDYFITQVNNPASSIMSYDNANTRAELQQNGSYVDAYALSTETFTNHYVGGGYDYPNAGYTDKGFSFITFGQYLTTQEMTDYQYIINSFQGALGRNIY